MGSLLNCVSVEGFVKICLHQIENNLIQIYRINNRHKKQHSAGSAIHRKNEPHTLHTNIRLKNIIIFVQFAHLTKTQKEYCKI